VTARRSSAAVGVPFTVGAEVALGDGTNDGGLAEVRGLPESDDSGVRDVPAVVGDADGAEAEADALDCPLPA